MKRLMMTLAAGFIAGTIVASPLQEGDGDYKPISPYFNYLPPTYLDDVYADGGWKSNWFISVQGGFSAFLGTPIGHGDFFDRTKILLNASVGKWITPTIGGRIYFQGMKLMDADMVSREYQNYHADFLYNITSHYRNDESALPKWDCIPYVGVGLINNSHTKNHPFAFSYGIIGRYRVAKRWHITSEIGCTTTFQDFDGNGNKDRFGDNLLQASIGLSATLGKVGWRRVIDPRPYIYQNDQMLHYINSEKEIAYNKRREAKKRSTESDSIRSGKPRNNYSGLNSLRQRMKLREQWSTELGEYNYDNNITKVSVMDSVEVNKQSDNECLDGEPIFFYFDINSTRLTPESRKIDIKEIANRIKERQLYVKIVGAADSKTGRARVNKKLGMRRAKYISSLLKDYGVDEERITIFNAGGINRYKPYTANRNVKLTIYTK
ncbi:MAG: OmpA family protein [Bacteroidaceae bacterium]|nr:OmpA family protein [Bacteroidaceae bacterium]